MAGRMIAQIGAAEYFGIDEGAGAPVIFLHGVMTDHRVWTSQAARLADRFRIICPDFREHGQSRGDGADLSVRLLADDLVNLVNEMSLDAPIIVGWSLGASVLLAAQLRGLAVRGAILVGATPQLVSDDRFPFGMAAAAAHARDAGLLHNFEKNARLFGAIVAAEDPDAAREFGELAAAATTSIFASSWTESLVPDLHRISAPTFLIHGAQDKVCSPKATEYLSEHLPDVRGLTIIDDAGNAPFRTRMAEFDRALDHALAAFGTNVKTDTPSMATAVGANSLAGSRVD